MLRRTVQATSSKRSAAALGVAVVGFLFVFGADSLRAQKPAATAGVLSDSLRQWPETPVRWLLLPEELREYRRLRSDSEARAFIRSFWERRDPDPATPVNEFAEEFSQRIAIADELYRGAPDDLARGSASERGGALLLLGAPSYIRVSRQRLPTLPSTSGAASRPSTAREVEREVWGYTPGELPRGLLELAPSLASEERVELTFEHGTRGDRLRSGRQLLALAARAAVRRPPS